MAKAPDENPLLDTLWLAQDGTEIQVGRLKTPQDFTEADHQPYVFLSHTGKDGVKEDIARPTHWFLTEVLKVKAFLDDASMVPEIDKASAHLADAAFQSTHALVLLSPSFRKRKLCVMELNTFMHRFRRSQEATLPPKATNHQGNGHSNGHGNGKDVKRAASFRLLLALWLLDNVDGYHRDLQNMDWIVQQTSSPVYYMLFSLWPSLVQSLGFPAIPYRQLREIFFHYVRVHHEGPFTIPGDFVRFLQDHGVALKEQGSLSLLPLVASTAENSSLCGDAMNSFIGISFSRFYMDDDQTWNAEIVRQKDRIDGALDILASYGTVTYGKPKVELKPAGWFGLGTPIPGLECEIEMRDKLGADEYRQVHLAASEIASILKSAGASDEDLEHIFIGTAWKQG